MRALRAIVPLAVLALAALTMVMPSSASAAGCPRVAEDGICLSDQTHPAPPIPPIAAPPPGEDTDGGGAEQTIAGVGSGASRQCQDGAGSPIPCTNQAGNTWVSGDHNYADPEYSGGCYAFPLAQQPGTDSPLWQGNDPASGSLWSCDPTVSIPQNTWFVPAGQTPLPAQAPQPVDAAAVAQGMVDRAPFEVAQLQMAPPSGFHTYIRIENWFWVPRSQWHPVSVFENVGPASVTLTARPSGLVVDPGNGEAPTRCPDAGRPWRNGMSDAAKTTCSYTYESLDTPSGDTYQVTGRLSYQVSWTCSGLCTAPAGSLGEYPAPAGEAQPVEVRQRQTVVTG